MIILLIDEQLFVLMFLFLNFLFSIVVQSEQLFIEQLLYTSHYFKFTEYGGQQNKILAFIGTHTL